MPHGIRDQKSDAPSWTVESKNGKTGKDQFGNTVFGMSVAEAQVTKGAASPGWVRIVQGTGGRAGRKQFETLVATRQITTDATSFSNTATTNVANSSGTSDDSILPDA